MTASCFLIEPTDQVRRYLRRYAGETPCPLKPGKYSYHDQKFFLDIVQEYVHGQVDHGHDDWPQACACGYVFKDRDTWQTFLQNLYRRTDTGEEMTLLDAPPGAMWYADWMIHSPGQKWYRGPDGRCLVIRGFYGTDFCPDARASNCTLPNDDDHKCWVRTGQVPNITVGKDGPTCGAGAGSFFCGPNQEWHGFVRDGMLTP